MKQLYQVHMVLLLALFLGGIYWLSIYDVLYHQRDFIPESWSTMNGDMLSTWGEAYAYQRIAAVWAGLTFLWTVWVGYCSSQVPYLSKGLMGVGMAGVVWMVILFFLPDHLELQYVFLVWIIYITGGVVSTAYLLLKDAMNERATFLDLDDILLDDQWEPSQP